MYLAYAVMRKQVWNNFCNEKFKSFYLNVLNSRLRNLDLALNFIVALATTGSVATWAIWKKYPLLWVSIVGISQVIVVSKPFFPYLRDLRRLSELESLHEQFSFRFEKLWDKLQQGAAVDAEFWEIRESRQTAIQRFQDVNTPEWQWLDKRAREKRNVYLKVQFSVTT